MKNFLVVMIAVLVTCFSSSVMAVDFNVTEAKQIEPRFIAMIKCYNALNLADFGKMQCYAKTETRVGYIAKVEMELQQLDGDWSTIKTWSGKEEEYICLEKEWYVNSGYSYRLKVTHSAYTEDMELIESSTTYSDVIKY